MISVQNVNKHFGNLEVLKNISLNVAQGEVVSVVGASGAGKTTLLQIIGTLLRSDSGKVLIGGTDVTTLADKQLAAFRNANIGFVFQFHNLLPEFTAIENVCIPALIKGVPMDQAREQAAELLRFLKVDNRALHKPSQLSGGEQQRVAVARALVNKPAVVLADEPSGNLDSAHADELHQLFFELRDRYNQTFIIVTHNESLAAMADRKITIKDGQNIE